MYNGADLLSNDGSISAINADGTRYNQHNEWLLDSGSTHHIASRQVLKNIESGPALRLQFANGYTTDVRDYGTAMLSSRVTINGIAAMKNDSPNLISPAMLYLAGCKLDWQPNWVKVFAHDGECILKFKREKDSNLWIYTTGEYTQPDYKGSIKVGEHRIPRKSKNNANNNANNARPVPPANPATGAIATQARLELVQRRANSTNNNNTAIPAAATTVANRA